MFHPLPHKLSWTRKVRQAGRHCLQGAEAAGQEPGNAQVGNFRLSNLFTCNLPDVRNCFFPIVTLPTKRKYSSDVSESNWLRFRVIVRFRVRC